MNGRDFLNVARDLIAFPTEAHRRAGVECAYYALMLEGRDALLRWGFAPPPRDQVHAFVRLKFTFAAHRDLKFISDALEFLVRLRNQAQYQLSTPGPFSRGTVLGTAISRAQDALAVLDGIVQDPAQQAAAIGAIRAAGS